MIQHCNAQATISSNQNRKLMKNQLRKKWITNAILVSCRRKEMLYNLQKKNPLSDVLKNEYKNYEKIPNKVIKDAKYKYEREKIQAASGDTKKLWNIINQKLGKKRKNSNIINTKIDNKKDIVNTFNTYFCEVGS